MIHLRCSVVIIVRVNSRYCQKSSLGKAPFECPCNSSNVSLPSRISPMLSKTLVYLFWNHLGAE